MKRFVISSNLGEIEGYRTFCETIFDVHSIFSKCFGTETMLNIDLLVDNSTKGSGYTPIITPVFGALLIIKLGVEDFNNREQIAYQFSHELCHYVFYSLEGMDRKISTEEESVCSAMALIIMKELFPEKTFKGFCNYVSSVEGENYRKGLKVAAEVNFDMVKIKERILELTKVTGEIPGPSKR